MIETTPKAEDERGHDLEDDQSAERRCGVSLFGPNTKEAGGGETTQDVPVIEGEHRVVSVETYSYQRDGVARIDDTYPVIVPNTAPDDEVPVVITTVRPNGAVAERLDAL